MIDLAFDHLYNHTKGYPNLSVFRPQPYTAEWRQFDQHWPNVVPWRLIMYLDHIGLSYKIWSCDKAPAGSIYPIGFSWFDFGLDYVGLIPDTTKRMIQQGRLKLLFYYHEGDHPGYMRARLDELCILHGIDPAQTLLISANSASQKIDRCLYFDDFECWLWCLNRTQSAPVSKAEPDKDFTVLSRVNKSWRACIMWDLYRQGMLDNSLWSYASDLDMIDDPADNPLEYGDQWPEVKEFLRQGPYRCDHATTAQQNDHHLVNEKLYTASHLHIVIETHLDADGSNGCFITEKTYKCIKYQQPFLLIGTAGTLAMLRAHGYRVFDHVINNAYDLENNSTKRWHMILSEIQRLRSDLVQAWHACRSDCEHNALLFDQRPALAVNSLIQEISCRL